MTDDLLRPLRDPSALVRALLFAAVFVCVGVFDLGAQKPFDSVKWSTVWFFVSLAGGLWIVELLRRREGVRLSPLHWCALGFLASSAVSAVLSPTPMTALLGWYGRYTGLATVAVFVLAFFIVSSVYSGRADLLRQVIWAFAAGAIVLALYILMQWTGLDPIRWATTAGKIPGLKYFGTMGNADFAGGYLGLTSPVLFFAFRRAGLPWKRNAVGIWALAHVWCLWLTSARNGIAALGAGALVLVFVYRKSLPRLVRWGVLVVVIAGAVGAGSIVVSAAKAERGTGAGRGIVRSNTVKVRAYWWLAGIRMFTHHPVFGTGPDTFVSEYQRYLPPQASNVADSEIADKPHNVFIDHLATQGIVGTGFFLALLVLAFVRGYRRLRDGPPDERLVGATFLALLAAYCAQAFFSIDVIPIAFADWVILGAIAALTDAPARTAERPVRTVAIVAVVLTCVLVAAAGTAPLKADHEAHTAARITQAQGGADDVTLHYDRARMWDPFEPIHPGAEGDFLQKEAANESDELNKRGKLERAVELYRKMLSLQPTYHLWMMTLGRGLGDLAAAGGARFEEAERWLDKAERRAPYDWRVPTAHGDMLLAWARKTKDVPTACRALDEYVHALKLRKRQPSALIGAGKTFLALGQLDKAVEPFLVAVRVDPTSETAKSLLDSTRELIRKHALVKVATCS